ncbi:hypothetical protein HU200_005628 [Digitaria exilis]|uniref:Uncharacterized protein n=1 Tax=Digitaria exilis TaxID=1010633 RepID=A0A835FT02_9POAL|nr:hypothetical protein HU200_005628 [Digitaria exilis]
MAIPVARVHLAMAHAALPGLLRTPPKCTMLPLLPACAAIILPTKPSRADAAGRWDAHKIKRTGSPASTTSSSSSSDAMGDKKNLTTRNSSEERWDAHKKPAVSTASSSASSSNSSNKTKTCRRWISRRPSNGRASSAPERWDAHKKPAPDELDDGESSTGSNDVEMGMPIQPPPRSLYYAGPSFVASPEPSMLPMPSFLISVA